MSEVLERWPELSRLLDEALDLPDDAARARWLDGLAQEHRELRPHLARILAAGGDADRVMPAFAAARGLEPGVEVGPYRLVQELGRGGMAVVWKAQRAGAPEEVALKLPLVSLQNARFLERVAREGEFLRRLDHPNIAKLVDAGVDDSGQQYLALELVEGRPLVEHCDAQGLDVAARLDIFRQVLAAVAHTHARGIVHRDLKPSNILVTTGGAARLLDFGVAKLLTEGRAEETALTQAGGRPLTPDYASPEQLSGGTITPASDVYSLGVVLCELLSGSRPYRIEGTSRAQLEKALSGAGPPPPSELARADSAVARAEGGVGRLSRRLRGDLDAIVAKALQRRPEARYSGAEALAADLDNAVAGRRVAARGGIAQRAHALLRRHRLPIALAVVLWLMLGNLQLAHRGAEDLQQLFLAPLPREAQVALVTIGAEDYARLFASRSPLDPGVLGRLVRRIAEGRPSVLAIDIDTSHPSFAALAATLADSPATLVWAVDARSAPGERDAAPISALGGAAAPQSQAVALLIADADDGVTRRYSQQLATASGPKPSLVWAVASAARHGPQLRSPDESGLGIRFAASDRLDVPASVVMADGFDWSGRIAGRVVLLGGRYDRADVHDTPRGRMAGIDVLASAIETELGGGGSRAPGIAQIALIGFAQILVLFVLFDNLPFRQALPAALAGTALVSWLLAATNVFPAWPYAFFALALVLANLLFIEALRSQRKVINEAFQAARARRASP